MLVEEIPPFRGRDVKARGVEGGDGVEALGGILLFAVGVVCWVWDDVVPGVVGEDVVGGFEVALAELEGGGAFGAGVWVVGAVGWDIRSGGEGGEFRSSRYVADWIRWREVYFQL